MFVKKRIKCLAISSVFVVSLLFILKDSGKHLLLFFLEIISFIVFKVFLMSDLFFSEGGRKVMLFGCACASLYYCTICF